MEERRSGGMYTQSLLQDIETIERREGESDLFVEVLACRNLLRLNSQIDYKWSRRLGDRN